MNDAAADPQVPRQRTAIVTGDGRGIGRAIVQALTENGWGVAFCGRDAERTAAGKGASGPFRRTHFR